MTLLSPEFNNLQELFVMRCKGLYDMEKRIIDALPAMEEAAHSPELKNAFRQHLQETETHCTRLEKIFQRLGMEPTRETCDGIKGIIKDGECVAGAKGDPVVRDAGLIGAAQCVEHFEMSAYGTARTFAEQLGLKDVAGWLEETLDEEKRTDAKLTELAESRINAVAAH